MNTMTAKLMRYTLVMDGLRERITAYDDDDATGEAEGWVEEYSPIVWALYAPNGTMIAGNRV